MNRSEWLAQMRREAEEKYDQLWSPEYHEKYGVYGNATHQVYLGKFLDLLPPGSAILDAACGAGRYSARLLEKGNRVIGVDQSQGMLASLSARFPDVQVEKIGLQELPYRAFFDGAICMDAMEHVCPEDWPVVLENLQRALKPKGVLYFTVEVAVESEVQAAYLRNQQAGLPVVYGEWPDAGVYHFYPAPQQVRQWIQQAGFQVLEETEGDSYRHFIVRSMREVQI